MAVYTVRTAADLSASIGKFVRLNAVSELLEINTTAGSRSLGVLFRTYQLGATQYAEVLAGNDFGKVLAGAAFAANVLLTNDALGRAVLAVGPAIVGAISVQAASGASVSVYAQSFSQLPGSSPVGGTGTPTHLARFVTPDVIGDSQITDDAVSIALPAAGTLTLSGALGASLTSGTSLLLDAEEIIYQGGTRVAPEIRLVNFVAGSSFETADEIGAINLVATLDQTDLAGTQYQFTGLSTLAAPNFTLTPNGGATIAVSGSAGAASLNVTSRSFALVVVKQSDGNWLAEYLPSSSGTGPSGRDLVTQDQAWTNAVYADVIATGATPLQVTLTCPSAGFVLATFVADWILHNGAVGELGVFFRFTLDGAALVPAIDYGLALLVFNTHGGISFTQRIPVTAGNRLIKVQVLVNVNAAPDARATVTTAVPRAAVTLTAEFLQT